MARAPDPRASEIRARRTQLRAQFAAARTANEISACLQEFPGRMSHDDFLGWIEARDRMIMERTMARWKSLHPIMFWFATALDQ